MATLRQRPGMARIARWVLVAFPGRRVSCALRGRVLARPPPPRVPAGRLTDSQLADQQLRDLPGPDEAAPLRSARKVSADDAHDVSVSLGRELLTAPRRPIADARLTQSLPVVSLDDGDLLAPRVGRGFLDDRVVERSRTWPLDVADVSPRVRDGRVLDADGLAQLGRGNHGAGVRGLARRPSGRRRS